MGRSGTADGEAEPALLDSAVTMGESALVNAVSVDSFVEPQYVGNVHDMKVLNKFKVPHNEKLGMVTKDHKSKFVSKEAHQLFLDRIAVWAASREKDAMIVCVGKQERLTEIVSSSQVESSFLKKVLTNLLTLMEKAFITAGDELPACVIDYHYVYLKDEKSPVFCAPHGLARTQVQQLMNKISDLEALGVLEKTGGQSPFNSPVFLVAKSEVGKWRMVNCFVELNKATAMISQYPMMRVDDTYALLYGMNWFATLDFSDGFYQIEIFPEHRQRTAFKIPGEGQWQYKRMAQGLAGAPATFNYVVNKILGPIREMWLDGTMVSLITPFVDDVLIASTTQDWQLFHLGLVLEAVKTANMVLSPKKTKLLQKSVQYLGRRIDARGILPTKEDIKRIMFWPKPETRKQLRSYLGFVNFLSDFVEFEKGITLSMRELQVDRRQYLLWTPDANAAFNKMRTMIMNSMRLAFPIYGRENCPFILTTDASKAALGATLRQKQPDGAVRVVSFGSRTMTMPERNYSMPHKEILANSYGLKKFDRIIRGQEILMELDHLALVKSYLSGKATDEKVRRWLVILQTYMPLQMQHIKSADNVADLLSRNPRINCEWDLLDEEEKALFETHYVNAVTASWPVIVAAVHVSKPMFPIEAASEGGETSVTEPEKDYTFMDEDEAVIRITAQSRDGLGADLMLDAQLEEEWCSGMIAYITDPTKDASKDIKTVAHQFTVQGGRLFKVSRLKPRLYVPKRLREVVIASCHDSKLAGHGGIYATYCRVSLDYFWKRMEKDVAKYVKTCSTCQSGKHGPYQHVHSGKVGEEVLEPFHTVNLDIKGPIIPTSSSGNKFIISWICTATRYVEAYAVPNKDAANVTASFTRLVLRHGFPRHIISDRDQAFLGNMLQSLSEEFNIKYTANPTEAKWMSGKVERFHGSLATILGHYVRSFPKKWDEMLPYALFAYRTAVQSRLNASPFQLLYGRLPVTESQLRFGADLLTNPIARDAAQRIQQAIAVSRRFEANKKERSLDDIVPGMKVWVKKIQGIRKDLDRWLGPFEVESVEGLNVTYVTGTGRLASAHRSQVKLYYSRESSSGSVEVE